MPFPPPSTKQARILWFALTAFAVGICLVLAGLFLWGIGTVLQSLSAVLLPLAVAGVIAYLLDPLVDFLEKKKVPRKRAILLVFFVAIMAVLILFGTLVPRIISETGGLIQKAPGYSKQLKEKIEGSKWGKRLNETLPRVPNQPTNTFAITVATNSTDSAKNGIMVTPSPSKPSSSSLTEKIISWGGEIVPEISTWAVTQLKKAGSWIGLFIGFLLVPIYVFYLLCEKRAIEKNWTDYLPLRESRAKEEIVFIISSINECLIVFFRGQVLVAMCTGTLLTTSFLIMGLNYGVLLGIIAGILGIIPYIGMTISLIPAVALAAMQFGDWLHPLLVVAIFGIVNMLEGLFISPKIIGDRVGLHPLTIIIAVMVGTNLMGGLLGGVLAIPLTAALRAMMFRYVWKKRAH